MCSDPRAWKQLISHGLSTDERVSLITSIFSDRDKTEEVERLSGDDAQTFIDVIDEVSVYTFLLPPKNGLTPTNTSIPCRLGVG